MPTSISAAYCRSPTQVFLTADYGMITDKELVDGTSWENQRNTTKAIPEITSIRKILSLLYLRNPRSNLQFFDHPIRGVGTLPLIVAGAFCLASTDKTMLSLMRTIPLTTHHLKIHRP
ncbi:MAG: hypothetical protein ABI162_01815 [Luteolibacter sp.]